jgi:hypothetical protein
MKKILATMAVALATTLSHASDIQLDGTVAIKIKSKTPGFKQSMSFKLPKVALSDNAKAELKRRMLAYKKHGPQLSMPSFDIPSHYSVGMQGTPVLDQGAHGSCVTFAVTAAYDAAIGAGDYISQLCSLELGSYLSIHDKVKLSGWNGSYASWVLSQIKEYGVISKNFQKLNGCAGVREYPLSDENDEGKPMSASDYKQHSLDISKLVSWQAILESEEAFSAETDMNAVVDRVKHELAKGNRLTFGMLLDVNYGDAGAVGQNKVLNDTWMLNPQIMTDILNDDIYAAHEMIITAYDDNATVIDEDGFTNKGVFTVRNSWSQFAGDNGNYYVSYDHFKMMADEVHLITLKK